MCAAGTRAAAASAGSRRAQTHTRNGGRAAARLQGCGGRVRERARVRVEPRSRGRTHRLRSKSSAGYTPRIKRIWCTATSRNSQNTRLTSLPRARPSALAAVARAVRGMPRRRLAGPAAARLGGAGPRPGAATLHAGRGPSPHPPPHLAPPGAGTYRNTCSRVAAIPAVVCCRRTQKRPTARQKRPTNLKPTNRKKTIEPNRRCRSLRLRHDSKRRCGDVSGWAAGARDAARGRAPGPGVPGAIRAPPARCRACRGGRAGAVAPHPLCGASVV